MWVFSVDDAAIGKFRPADAGDLKAKPENTLSGEMRRFWNAMRQECRRNGWPVPEYAWAAESKSSGERDYHPHVHCLTTLVVLRKDFEELTTTAERIWGHGSVHMATLRKPRNAAAYCLKGVSYSTKGTSEGQGRVWGRRYGVSKALRHHEVRTAHEVSEVAADAVREVADALRALEQVAVKTAYGTFTRRGFYPHEGATWEQVPLAARIALAKLHDSPPSPRESP